MNELPFIIFSSSNFPHALYAYFQKVFHLRNAITFPRYRKSIVYSWSKVKKFSSKNFLVETKPKLKSLTNYCVKGGKENILLQVPQTFFFKLLFFFQKIINKDYCKEMKLFPLQYFIDSFFLYCKIILLLFRFHSGKIFVT